MTTDSVSVAVHAYFRELSEGESDAFVALFSADARIEDPVGMPALIGHEGAAKLHRNLRRAWSALRMTPTATYARDRSAAAHWTASGTSSRGNAVAFEGIDVFEVDAEGRITRLEGYWDFDAVVGQL